MFLYPLLKTDPVNRTFLLGTIRTLSFGADTCALAFDSNPAGVYTRLNLESQGKPGLEGDTVMYRNFLTALCAAILAAFSLCAQSERGTITGTVLDASG